MASLINTMSGGNRFEKVHVDDIRPNPNNFYAHVSEDETELVENMGKLLIEDGLDTNGLVYEDTSLDDGKKYTLLAGERRWKAIKLNMERGAGDGLFEVKIISKPTNHTEEMLRIIRNNAQRNKGKDIRSAEIKALENIWDELKEQGKKPVGKKRDWIAMNVGLSPRRVQEYLTGEESESKKEEGGSTSTSTEVEPENYVQSSQLEWYKTLSENMTEAMGYKVKISKKGVISFDTMNGDNMESVLNALGFDENGYMK